MFSLNRKAGEQKKKDKKREGIKIEQNEKKRDEDLYFLHSFLIELLDFLISIRITSARTIRDAWTFNILEEKRDRLEIRLRILWFFLLIRYSRVVCSIHDESKKHLLLEKGDLETTNFLPPRFSKVEHFLSSDKCDFKRTPSPPFLLHPPPPLSLFFSNSLSFTFISSGCHRIEFL